MTHFIAVLALVAQAQTAPSAPASTPPPDTEIYLATLAVRGETVVIGTPLNISENPGYDNQPSFTPDGLGVLFTSVRGGRKADSGNSAATGSDIYRYDLKAGRISQVTDTAESEYSPVVTPDGGHISVVRVESDGTQRLWRFSTKGQSPELVLREIKPVGYHVWVDADTLALFVLGQPPTLQVVERKSGKAEVIASSIGRSLQRMPDGGISYVLREASTATEPPGRKPIPRLSVNRFDPKTGQTRQLVQIPDGATDADLAWTPDGMLLMALQGQLLGWREGDKQFRQVFDLASLGLKGVTRLAVHPGGELIAVVAQKP